MTNIFMNQYMIFSNKGSGYIKKYIILSVSAIVLIVLFITLYITFNIKIDESYSANNNQTNIAKVTNSKTNDNKGYTLKEYKNKIAVFEGASGTPTEVFDVYVDSLPVVDQKSIKKGIHADTKEELQTLIEDFTS